MSNFSCYQNGEILMEIDRYSRSRDLEDQSLPTRFFHGENLWGFHVFRKLIMENPQYDAVLNGKRRLIRQLPHEKRVFISHRRADETKAKSIASALNKVKISYWLDVLDPTLSTNQSLSAIIIANIIEVALGYLRKPVYGLIKISVENSKWIFPIYTSLFLRYLANARLPQNALSKSKISHSEPRSAFPELPFNQLHSCDSTNDELVGITVDSI